MTNTEEQIIRGRHFHGVEYNEYCRIHYWINRNYGKASKCEEPLCNKKSSRYQWALKKGEVYKRDISIYLQLCRSCHAKYDFTAEGKEKIRNARKGKILTTSHRMRIGNSHKRKINQFSLNGNFIQSFSSELEAARTLNIGISGISHCLSGRYKNSGGFIWKR